MKKRVEMNSRKILFIGIISLIFGLSFVFAAHTVFISSGETSFNFAEDTAAARYNITINNSDSGASANITQVNITMPLSFIFLSGSNNSNSPWITFTNITTNTSRILSWTNSTGFLINGSANSTWFSFNATASTPGTYNISVITLNGTGNYTTNISVTINDTTAPSLISFVSPGISTDFANLSQTSIPINVSVTDNGIVSTINITLYNLTGPMNSTINISNVSSWFFNFTGILVDGNYTINVTVNDTYGNRNSSFMNVTIDRTNPLMGYNIGTLTDVLNSSVPYIHINISANETYQKNITFNIYHSNGSVLNSTTYTNRTININVTGMIDDIYSYNVTVYDYAGNTNSTTTRSIRIDRVAPTITFACSPTTLTASGTVTCSCSASDATSGVLGSPSFTLNPTVSYGTHTTTCTVGDHAGNNATSSVSYTVSGGSPSSGSGGGSSTSTKTYIPSTTQFGSGYTQQLKSDERIKLTIASQTHYVSVSSLTATSATISVTSTPQTATLNIGEEKKFDVTEDGYYDLSVKLNSIKAGKADITIKSINEKIPAAPQQQEASTTAQTPSPTSGELPEETPTNLTWLWIIVIIVVVLIVVWIVYNKSKHRR